MRKVKLESLMSSKFETFKGKEISNAMNIRGGCCVATFNKGSNTENDSYSKDWSSGPAAGGRTWTDAEKDIREKGACGLSIDNVGTLTNGSVANTSLPSNTFVMF